MLYEVITHVLGPPPVLSGATVLVRHVSRQMPFSGAPACVHRLDQVLVFLVDQPSLELHRRGQLLVLGAQLGLDQAKALDLLDPGKMTVHLV